MNNFAKREVNAIREMREKLDAQRGRAERPCMRCPRCGDTLIEREQNSVKIDVCQKCHGVWLDKGELEQLQRVNRGHGIVGGVLAALLGKQ